MAAAYAVSHPSRVRHLILADPWGIISKDDDDMREDPVLWQRAAMCISNTLKSNPFDVLRDSGPLGKLLLGKKIVITIWYRLYKKIIYKLHHL